MAQVQPELLVRQGLAREPREPERPAAAGQTVPMTAWRNPPAAK
jgi:hypothetical protein